MTIAILDLITCFPHFALIAHHGIERGGAKRVNRNDRCRQTDTESNNRYLDTDRGDVAYHTEINLSLWYLPHDLTSAKSQRVEGYGDISILIPLPTSPLPPMNSPM